MIVVRVFSVARRCCVQGGGGAHSSPTTYGGGGGENGVFFLAPGGGGVYTCILFLLFVCGVVWYACVVTDGQDVCSPSGRRGYADQ